MAVSLLLAALAGTSLADSEAGPVSRRYVVGIEDFEFRPARIEVMVGDTIVWVNRDIVPHTATAAGGGWDSGTLVVDDSWSWVASAPGPGEIAYVCEFHPSMTGKVLVRSGGEATQVPSR